MSKLTIPDRLTADESLSANAKEKSTPSKQQAGVDARAHDNKKYRDFDSHGSQGGPQPFLWHSSADREAKWFATHQTMRRVNTSPAHQPCCNFHIDPEQLHRNLHNYHIASSNKCIASSNKCLTSSNKKLVMHLSSQTFTAGTSITSYSA